MIGELLVIVNTVMSVCSDVWKRPRQTNTELQCLDYLFIWLPFACYVSYLNQISSWPTFPAHPTALTLISLFLRACKLLLAQMLIDFLVKTVYLWYLKTNCWTAQVCSVSMGTSCVSCVFFFPVILLKWPKQKSGLLNRGTWWCHIQVL